MASILHGNAKTMPQIRKEIQNSNASISELAKIYHLTPLKLLANGNQQQPQKTAYLV